MSQPVLHSARLRLEPLRDDHLRFEEELDTDPAVMMYVGGAAQNSEQVARSHRRRMELGSQREGLGFWIAVDGTDFIGLMMLPPAHGPDQPSDPEVVDLGYRLATHAWGRGYGREAAQLLLSHAFETVGIRRVIAQTREDNHRSRALLTDVGMRYVRYFRSADDHTNGPLDTEYEMTRRDWAVRQRQLA